MRSIHIGDHGIRGDPLAIGKLDAGGDTALKQDTGDRCACPNGPPTLDDHVTEDLGDPMHAAARMPGAERRLGIRDHRQGAGRTRRIGAGVRGEALDHLLQPRIAKPSLRDLRQRHVCLNVARVDWSATAARNVDERPDRFRQEEWQRHLPRTAPLLQQGVPLLPRAVLEPLELGGRAIVIAPGLEVGAIVPPVAADRLDREELEHIVEAYVSRSQRVGEGERHRHQRWARIERVAVARLDVELATDRLARLQHGHRTACADQADGGAEPADACADHDDVRHRQRSTTRRRSMAGIANTPMAMKLASATT